MKIYIVFKPGLELVSPGPKSKALTTRLSGSSIIESDFILQTLLKKLADFFTFVLTDFLLYRYKYKSNTNTNTKYKYKAS